MDTHITVLAPGMDDLRYWLANEDWYLSGYTRKWLQHTPPEEAAEVLAEIAADAQPEPRGAWQLFLLFLTWFSLSGSIGPGPARRKAGIRAAVLLARMGDSRALEPLVRVYETVRWRQSRYHELIESALIRLLASPSARPGLRPHVSVINDLARRVWSLGGGRRDLDPGAADLLVAALKVLASPGVEGDLTLVREIAGFHSTARCRAGVAEAARSLLRR